MKNILIYTFFIICFHTVFGQTYEMDVYNNQTVTTCTGTFYDSGGQSGQYLANENYTVTFCPSSTGQKIKVDFNSFGVTSGDLLIIYNGASTSSAQLGVFDISMSPVNMQIQATAGNASGCLTFQFISQGSASGWSANISCTAPCQLVYSGLQSTVPPINPDSIYIDVCKGDTVTFTGTGIFPENYYVYVQSNSTSSFYWDISNGVSDSGQNIQVLFDSIGGYDVDLMVIDSNGCESINDLGVRVRVSTEPTFDSTFAVNQEICLGDTVSLVGTINPTSWQTSASLNWAGQTYLPDGSGVSYTSNLTFNIFNPGQTLTNINDLVGIFATIEHSYLGDLEIKIKCPGNQTVILKQYPGGTNTFLGEPVDNNAQPIPGVGYLYSWTSNPTYNTMVNEAGNYNYSYVNTLGVYVNNHPYLPSGSYASYQPLTNLIGCPLNGNWTLTVTDNIAIDNGFIFDWGIEFAQSVLPTSWGYTPGYDTSGQYWQNDPSIVNNNGNVVQASPFTTGYKDYTFVAVDSFGCSYDTTISVYVHEPPDVNLGPDTFICYNDSFPILQGPQGNNYAYTWMRNGIIIGNNQNFQTDSVGTYVLIIDSASFCSNSDTIQVDYVPLPQSTITFDHEKCTLGNGSIDIDIANDTAGQYTYTWNTTPPQTGPSVSNLSAGLYIVTISDGSCIYIDSVELINYPPPDVLIDSTRDEYCGQGNGYASVNVNGGTPPYTFEWNTTPMQSTSVVTNLGAGTYTISVSDSFCDVSQQVVIANQPGPDAHFSVSPNVAQMPNPKFDFQDESTGNPIQWFWDFGDFTGTSTQQNPVYTYSTPGYYLVELEIADDKGCTDTTSKQVYVRDISTLYVPNAFTPSNADGLNDMFLPLGYNLDREGNYEMYIFNRWGELIYYTDDYTKPWNGRKNNAGEHLHPGTYMYKIYISQSDGIILTKSGFVTLL